jgi:hypothetical protein
MDNPEPGIAAWIVTLMIITAVITATVMLTAKGCAALL